MKGEVKGGERRRKNGGGKEGMKGEVKGGMKGEVKGGERRSTHLRFAVAPLAEPAWSAYYPSFYGRVEGRGRGERREEGGGTAGGEEEVQGREAERRRE